MLMYQFYKLSHILYLLIRYLLMGFDYTPYGDRKCDLLKPGALAGGTIAWGT